MFGHMKYFISPKQRPDERKHHHAQPEDFVRLWGPNGRPQRSFGKR